MSGFGERLRTIRGAQSKKAFAQRLGVSPQNYQYYEAGRIPNVDRLKSIAGVLGVSVDYLLGVDSENSPSPRPRVPASSPASPAQRSASEVSGNPTPSPRGPSTLACREASVPYHARSTTHHAPDPTLSDLYTQLSTSVSELATRLAHVEQLLIQLIARKDPP